MTETADDLSAPLGQDKPRRKRRLRLPFTAMQALTVMLGLFLVAFAGFAIFNKDPLGGEPMTRIAIREPRATDEKPAAASLGQESKPESKHEAKEAPKQAGEQKTVTMIDGSTGTRHDVVIGGGDAADKGDAAAASAPPPVMAGIDPKLLEKSRYGMIPVTAEGAKPFNVYAADADRAKAAKMPVVAILIGGLGVGAAKTTDAIMRLPPAVTLAFTPYGADPGKLAERARAQRHEIFLQIPMEPYDFPDNDPGPQTAADLAHHRPEHGPPVLAPEPDAGLCRPHQFHGRPFRGDRRRDAADHPRGGQARPRLLRRRLLAAQHRAPGRGQPGDAVRQGRYRDRRGADPGGDRPRPEQARIDGARARRCNRHRLRPAGLDRAHRQLDQDIERPWYPFGAVDNRDAEIKI
ncbi:hypothetical protein ACVWZR_003470 [Bradyrhizobium sp. i1.3.1]